MQQIDVYEYNQFLNMADSHDCGKIYPCSIAEGIQHGEIFTDAIHDYRAVLFWHHCGFAYLAGQPDDCFLEEIYERILDRNNTNSRRFILMTKNDKIERYFASKTNIVLEHRYLFDYMDGQCFSNPIAPDGYELKEIDARLLSELSGNIVPSLFWEDLNRFLVNGKGYCLTHGNDIAAWAFSAAVSSKEIDIGIETSEKYQKQGLATIVANKMIQYTLEVGKKPVWACHYQNNPSAKMAEKIGFKKVAECTIVKKK